LVLLGNPSSAHRITKGDLYPVRELPLLFGTRIAVDSVWPNGHRACVHLLLNISLLESPGNLIMSEFAPPVCFSEPLPQALRRCGYKTFSLYPFYGTFLGARMFQTTAGIEHFIDLREMGVKSDLQPDHFFYDQALRLIERERGGPPLFIFVYVAVNHFPWNWTFRADLTPDWKELGNEPQVEEYIRRQTMSARDYADFLTHLRRDFLKDSFLLLRFGDHQPAISARILNPSLDDAAVAQRFMLYDPIFLDLLRDRHYQFQTGRFVLGTRYPRRALPAAGHPGGRRLAA